MTEEKTVIADQNISNAEFVSTESGGVIVKSGVVEHAPMRQFEPVAIDPFVQMIAAAARDPSTDVAKLNGLYDLMERRNRDQAKVAFDEALARAQQTFPIIPENGRLKIYSKALRELAAKEGEHVYRGQTPQQNTPYPLWEDVVAGITPSLSREGLSMSFDVQIVSAGDAFKIIVVGYLKRSGFTVEAKTPPLQHDSTGSKNSIQAIKSTTSYGKSMVAGFLTNFASRNESDEGQGGAPLEGAEESLPAEDLNLLRKAIADTNTNVAQFLDILKADSIETVNITQWRIAMSMLAQKQARAKKQAEAEKPA